MSLTLPDLQPGLCQTFKNKSYNLFICFFFVQNLQNNTNGIYQFRKTKIPTNFLNVYLRRMRVKQLPNKIKF